MRHSCAVCSLTVALCLVICVYASKVVSKEDAERAVTDAKESVTAVRDKAQKELNDAQIILDKVQSSKSEAAQAYSQAANAAKENTKAVQIAETIKSFSDAVDNLYADVQQNMDTAVSSLSALLKEAQRLESEPEIQITAKGEPADDYTEAKNTATALKAQAEEIKKNITDAVKGYTGVDSKANEMANKAKDAQLGESHVSAIVAVAKIETVIREGESIITQINNKKNEVNDIVTEMQILKEKALTKSIDSINTLFQDARGELTKATGAVDSAVKDKASMTQQKEAAAAALSNVATAKEVETAKKAVDTTNECVKQVQQFAAKLKSALKTAKDSVTNARALKQKLITALSTTTTAPSTVQPTETAKANPLVAQGTVPDQKDATTQPTSKELPDQNNNRTDKIKDTLSNGAQNVSTTALTGGKAPAAGANNDSAMTVSVPLLVALIASAALQ